MRYVGSKRRLVPVLLKYILPYRKPGQMYVEPFCGAGNSLVAFENPRMGNDACPELIMLLEAAAKGWVPPTDITEAQYHEAKTSTTIDPALKAFIGFGCSFGAKWFGGYARGKTKAGASRSYAAETSRRLVKMAEKLQGAQFTWGDYAFVAIPPKSLVYCDPPYAGTLGYGKQVWDSARFWQWADALVDMGGHTVFVSEYAAPENWECVWEGEMLVTIDNNAERKTAVERLFFRNGGF